MKPFKLKPFLIHVTLIVSSFLFSLPFIWMILTSFKPKEEIFSSEFKLLPDNFALIENYTAAFTQVDLLGYLFNGFVVVIAIFVLQIVFALPAAYAIAKLKFKGSKLFFSLVLFSLLIPQFVFAIPVYFQLHLVNMLDTYASLVFPWTISVFSIFLIRQFFLTIPDDILYAARIDGMSEFTIAWKIMLPSAMPAIIACVIVSVVTHWNDYFWPLIAISDDTLYTPPLGVTYFKDETAGTEYGPLMAASTIIVLPLVIAFLAAQEKFIKGLSSQAGMK
jgi:multiple sugar transport system permease protein